MEELLDITFKTYVGNMVGNIDYIYFSNDACFQPAFIKNIYKYITDEKDIIYAIEQTRIKIVSLCTRNIQKINKHFDEINEFVLLMYKNYEFIKNFDYIDECMYHFTDIFKRKNINEIKQCLSLYYSMIKKIPDEQNSISRYSKIVSNIMLLLDLNDSEINKFIYNADISNWLLKEAYLYVSCLRGDEKMFNEIFINQGIGDDNYLHIMIYSLLGRNKYIINTTVNEYFDRLLFKNNHKYSDHKHTIKLFYYLCYENNIELLDYFVKNWSFELYHKIMSTLSITVSISLYDMKTEQDFYKFDINKFAKSLIHIYNNDPSLTEFNKLYPKTYCKLLVDGLPLANYNVLIKKEREILISNLKMDYNIANIISDYYLPEWVYEMANSL